MITYQYKARDKFGNLAQGLMSADSEGSVAFKLKQMGYIPIAIDTDRKRGLDGNMWGIFKRVKASDLNMFTRQFFTLQKAGLPILSSLYTIREQTSSKILAKAIGEIARSIEEGENLTSALERQPDVFNNLFVNMVRAGEVSGKLPEILERLAILGEQEEKMRLRIQGAMRYPLIVVTAIAIGFFTLITFVVPRFAKLYSQFKTELPLPTRMLILTNYLIAKFWWLLIIAFGIFVFLFRNAVSSKAGRLWWDHFKLKIYIFGPLTLKCAMSRFCRITSMLMRSGVPLLQILDLVSKSIGNTVLAENLDKIKRSVNEGKGMSEPMKQSRLFPPMVVQMVIVGEQTGKMEELLLHISDYYDSQIDLTINNLVALIEPILIFFLGIVVLFMALGIFMPMWNLMHLFKK